MEVQSGVCYGSDQHTSWMFYVGRCPIETEHPLRNLLKKDLCFCYFAMKPSAEHPRIAFIRDVTDSNVIKLLLES